MKFKFVQQQKTNTVNQNNDTAAYIKYTEWCFNLC